MRTHVRLGQKQTLDSRPLMSALPPKADIGSTCQDVRFVPKADILVARRQRLPPAVQSRRPTSFNFQNVWARSTAAAVHNQPELGFTY
jgi:hypothetical protein